MKKKIFLILCMCLCLLGMTACQETDPTTEDYNGLSYEYLQNMTQNTIETLMTLTDEDKMNYLAAGNELTVNMITRWDDACDDVGNFVKYGEMTVSQTGKILTVERELEFEQRPVRVAFIYDYNTMEVTDVTIDAVLSTNEKLSTAGMNTLMGICTVFVILIVISLIIYAFRIIPYLTQQKKEPVPEVKKAPVVQPEAVVEEQDDFELVAVIAAAIAASTGVSTEDFVVRSIKRR